jgi:hypothetical protein
MVFTAFPIIIFAGMRREGRGREGKGERRGQREGGRD